jgi:AraC-like DNA-binding protein
MVCCPAGAICHAPVTCGYANAANCAGTGSSFLPVLHSPCRFLPENGLLFPTLAHAAEGNWKVAWSKVLTFTDPHPYTSAVLTADMQLFPTAKGDFQAELTQVVLDRLRMQRFEENLPRVHRGAIRRERKVFTFLTADQPEVSNRGRVFSLGEICADDFELQHVRTGGSYRLGAASLLPEDFAASCKAIVGCELDADPSSRFIRPPSKAIERFLTLHEMIGGIAKTMPELFEVSEVVRSLEQQLIHALIRCVTEGVVSPVSSGKARHQVIVARFEEFLEANPNSPLYLAEVCAAVGATERTLRAACEEHVGMGPIRYLTLRRMHLVRRALARAVPSAATVTQIATDHGFWELGRFSVAYRTMFGENPAQTLKRPVDDCRGLPMVHRRFGPTEFRT